VELGEDTRARRSSRSGSADLSETENREKASRSNSSEDLSTSSSAQQNRVNLYFSTATAEKGEEEMASELEMNHLRDVCSSLDLPSAFDEYALHRHKKIQKNIKM
jgi:hypothetical protein